MPVRAILFDNDGVLVETEHLYFRASREILAEEGVELDRDTFVDVSLRRGESLMRLAPGDESAVRARTERRDRRYTELLEERSPAIPEAAAVLDALRARARLAIVTTSLRHHFESAHRRSGLLDRFEAILTREDYARAKPHPEGYLAASERLGVPREDCVVVEDSERGLAAAVAAGIRCVVVPRGLTVGGRFDGAWRVLDRLEQIPAALDLLDGAAGSRATTDPGDA